MASSHNTYEGIMAVDLQAAGTRKLCSPCLEPC